MPHTRGRKEHGDQIRRCKKVIGPKMKIREKSFCQTTALRNQLVISPCLGNGRNTVSRVLFRKRELTEFCGKLGEFREELGETQSSLWNTNNRLRGTHWALSLELGEAKNLAELGAWNRLGGPLRLRVQSRFVGVSRGNTIRDNRTERFWEENLPLRGSLRGRVSEVFRVFRGFERVWEVFRGFQRFLEVFRGFPKALSETLSECHFPLRVAGCVAPNRVAP